MLCFCCGCFIAHKTIGSKKCLRRLLPGCVWDWSNPTPWLLQREILRADWCLVARRLDHLGRGRHCCRRILNLSYWYVRKFQDGIHSHINNTTVSWTRFYGFIISSLKSKVCLKPHYDLFVLSKQIIE